MAAELVFLFSDIEGSSALWERYPEEMAAALAHHDTVVRAAIEDRGGEIFKTGGDAFYAVLPSATAAAEAAVAAHAALRRPDAGPAIRSRIAIHAGAADRRDGDYFGPVLNRLARILAATNGGQTLVTATTADDIAAVEIAVHPLGVHRLRSISDPVALVEITVVGEEPSDRPLRSLDRGQLAHLAGWPALIGRADERRRLADLLRDSAARLITVTGTGGVGKTHLAYAIVADLAHTLDRRVALVECAALRSGGELIGAVASALSVPDRGDGTLLDQVGVALRAEPTLLVADNLEHLREASSIVGGLLAASAELRVIVTSRSALRVAGER